MRLEVKCSSVHLDDDKCSSRLPSPAVQQQLWRAWHSGLHAWVSIGVLHSSMFLKQLDSLVRMACLWCAALIVSFELLHNSTSTKPSSPSQAAPSESVSKMSPTLKWKAQSPAKSWSVYCMVELPCQTHGMQPVHISALGFAVANSNYTTSRKSF